MSERYPTASIALGLVLACSRPAPPASRAPSPTADDLAGIWYGVVESPTAHDGPIEIRRTELKWTGRYRERPADVTARAGRLRLVVPDAEFRGRQAAGALVGHWIQRRMELSGQPRATPLSLFEEAPGVFRGSVAGKRERDRYYIHIRRTPDGSNYRVTVRNPEANRGIWRSASRIDRDGHKLTFVNRAGSGSAFEATLEDGRMIARLFDRTVELTRYPEDSRELAGFWLRAPARVPYRYQVPPETGDGWQTADARAMGIDPAALERLVDRLASAPCTEDVRGLCPHGLVIALDGRLVLEAYFAGHTRETLHDTRSAGKSWATTIVGMAVDRRLLRPEDRVTDRLTAYLPFREFDARKQAITVGHHMSMSSGMACDDNDEQSPGQEGNLDPDNAGEDYARYILDLPMRRAPGTRGVYCSASMVLLAPIVEQASQEWSVGLVHRWLAEPLDIATYHLNLTPTLQAYFGGGIYLRPRDMTKLGQLFVAGGTWRGRRVVSQAWIDEALTPRARINHERNRDYGYGWWLKTYDVAGRKIEAFYASGNGGQLIFGFREIQAVVTFTGGNYANFPTWRAYIEEIVPQDVLPALVAAPSATRRN